VSEGPPELPDLASIALVVRWPPVEPQDAARAALAAGGLGPGYGRLGELAVWWASVRDDARAAAPARVVGIGVTSPLADGSHARVRRESWPDGDLSTDDALAWGIDLADSLADEGADLLLVAADDPVGRLVLAAALLDLGPVEALGWPRPEDGSRDPALTGLLDDARWMDEATALRDGLRRVRADEDHATAMLRSLGSTVLAAATGLLLRAAARRTPVVLDGPGAAAAGLLVRGQAWEAPDWWQVAPRPDDTLHERTVAGLRMTPLPGLAIAVEDGTASLLAADLVAAAAGLLAAAPPPAPPADLDGTGDSWPTGLDDPLEADAAAPLDPDTP
jgi:nicotinate-nucleotide--dimethylbenzimidazole phosphoribosyltransferase